MLIVASHIALAIPGNAIYVYVMARYIHESRIPVQYMTNSEEDIMRILFADQYPNKQPSTCDPT